MAINLIDVTKPHQFLAQDPAWVFAKGACHALALELYAEFEAIYPGTSGIWYFHPTGHVWTAVHVVAQSPTGFYDINFGPRTEAELRADYLHRDVGPLVPLPFLDWLTVPYSRWVASSCLGLAANPEFLIPARRRARLFIDRQRDAFGLPTRQASRGYIAAYGPTGPMPACATQATGYLSAAAGPG